MCMRLLTVSLPIPRFRLILCFFFFLNCVIFLWRVKRKDFCVVYSGTIKLRRSAKFRTFDARLACFSHKIHADVYNVLQWCVYMVILMSYRCLNSNKNCYEVWLVHVIHLDCFSVMLLFCCPLRRLSVSHWSKPYHQSPKRRAESQSASCASGRQAASFWKGGSWAAVNSRSCSTSWPQRATHLTSSNCSPLFLAEMWVHTCTQTFRFISFLYSYIDL